LPTAPLQTARESFDLKQLSKVRHHFTAELDPGFAGEDGRQFATTPLGMEGAVLQGVLIDEAIEVLFQRARDLGRSTRAWAVDEAWRALLGKAIDPLAQGGIGKLERVRDGLEALSFDNFTDRLGTPEDASLFRLFQHPIQRWEGVIGKVELEGPHGRALSYKVLQKYANMSHDIAR